MDEIEKGADTVIACAKKRHSLKPSGSDIVIVLGSAPFFGTTNTSN